MISPQSWASDPIIIVERIIVPTEAPALKIDFELDFLTYFVSMLVVNVNIKGILSFQFFSKLLKFK